MPIQSTGDYNVDFDNLDSVNPFQSSSKMTLSPPKNDPFSTQTRLTEPAPATEEAQIVTDKADVSLDETLPFIPSVESSLADFSADGTSTDSTVIIEPRKTTLADPGADDTVNEVPEPVGEDVVSVSLPKGSYEIDFENLDLVDPFKSAASKIQNSPPVSRKSPVLSPAPCKVEDASSGVKDVKVTSEQEEKLSTMEKPSLTEVSSDTAAPSTASQKEAPVVLEFNFDDGAEVKRKPPPKRLGLKRPPLSKAKSDTTRPASAPVEKKSPEIKPKSCDVLTGGEMMEIPPARGSYTIDLDQFNDPNFNPFGTSVTMHGSPPCNDPSSTSPVKTEIQDSAVESRTHGSVRRGVNSGP